MRSFSRYFTALLLALTAFTLGVTGQSRITGQVVDSLSRKGLSGVPLTVNGPNGFSTQITTNEAGYFELLYTSVDQGQTPERFQLGSAYPNPGSEHTQIEVSLPAAQTLPVQIFNVLGQRVYSAHFALTSGVHRLRISGLSTGMYVAQIGGQFSSFVSLRGSGTIRVRSEAGLVTALQTRTPLKGDTQAAETFTLHIDPFSTYAGKIITSASTDFGVVELGPQRRKITTTITPSSAVTTISTKDGSHRFTNSYFAFLDTLRITASLSGFTPLDTLIATKNSDVNVVYTLKALPKTYNFIITSRHVSQGKTSDLLDDTLYVKLGNELHSFLPDTNGTYTVNINTTNDDVSNAGFWFSDESKSFASWIVGYEGKKELNDRISININTGKRIFNPGRNNEDSKLVFSNFVTPNYEHGQTFDTTKVDINLMNDKEFTTYRIPFTLKAYEDTYSFNAESNTFNTLITRRTNNGLGMVSWDLAPNDSLYIILFDFLIKPSDINDTSTKIDSIGLDMYKSALEQTMNQCINLPYKFKISNAESQDFEDYKNRGNNLLKNKIFIHSEVTSTPNNGVGANLNNNTYNRTFGTSIIPYNGPPNYLQASYAFEEIYQALTGTLEPSGSMLGWITKTLSRDDKKYPVIEYSSEGKLYSDITQTYPVGSIVIRPGFSWVTSMNK